MASQSASQEWWKQPPQAAPVMRESDATKEVWEAWRRYSSKNPTDAARIKAIRSNPALGRNRIVAQYAPDGAIEIDPSVTSVDDIEQAIAHEVAHAFGRNEADAQAAERAYRPGAMTGRPDRAPQAPSKAEWWKEAKTQDPRVLKLLDAVQGDIEKQLNAPAGPKGSKADDAGTRVRDLPQGWDQFTGIMVPSMVSGAAGGATAGLRLGRQIAAQAGAGIASGAVSGHPIQDAATNMATRGVGGAMERAAIRLSPQTVATTSKGLPVRGPGGRYQPGQPVQGTTTVPPAPVTVPRVGIGLGGRPYIGLGAQKATPPSGLGPAIGQSAPTVEGLLRAFLLSTYANPGGRQ